MQRAEAGDMMAGENLIVIGGIYHLACTLLHVAFPRALNWSEDLASVSPMNRAVYWILSKLLMYAYALLGVGSIVFASDILHSSGGHFLLLSVSGFWLLRAAFQLHFFSVFDDFSGRAGNLALFSIWLLGSALYAVPLVL